jgi:hypothetical protein
MIIWESTLDTIQELLKSVQIFLSNLETHLEPSESNWSRSDLHHTVIGLQDCVHEVRLYQGKTKSLLKKVQGTALVVRFQPEQGVVESTLLTS